MEVQEEDAMDINGWKKMATDLAIWWDSEEWKSLSSLFWGSL